MKRLPYLLGVLLLLLLAGGERWPSATAAELALPFEDIFIAPSGAKPNQNWRVCRDLGVGDVNGLGIRRQRFRLCHAQGWEVLTYCLEPNLPAPAVGTRCMRTDANTYWCGSGLQLLREYSVEETPTLSPTRASSPTVTPTITPTATSTPTPTPTTPPSAPQPVEETPKAPPKATRRAPAGGRGNFDLSGLVNLSWLAAPTRTPYQPRVTTPTPFQPRHPTAVFSPAATQPPSGFYGLDLDDPEHRVRILIFPPNRRVNHGKPILISFIPGQICNYGDNHACINVYSMDSGAAVTFITVHSGVGGEGQAFRNAVEGTGINSAGLSLKEVRANLNALDGAEVVIVQGKRRYEGYILAVTARIPPKLVRAYFEAPVQEALLFASTIEARFARLSGLAGDSQPLLVFETCGWRIPGEPWAKGLTSTTASIYLGVIQKKNQKIKTPFLVRKGAVLCI